MNVKRFIGVDNNDAMFKVKRELGSDAVILHTRKIKAKGWRGWFKKPLIEIVAAIEEQKVESSAEKVKNEEAAKLLAEMNSYRQVQKASNEDLKTISTNSEISQIKEQMQEMQTMLKTALDGREGVKTEKKSVFSSNKDVQNLLEKGVNVEIIENLEKRLSNKGIDFSDRSATKTALKREIAKLVGKNFSAEKDTNKQKIYYFVGPTGVGKTTTIAKIAAKLALVDNKKVSLITADTYRIAAVDQLKTYSEILSLPLDVIYETSDIEKIMQNKDEFDYILIDTAGRNHKDAEMRTDLEALLAKTNNHQVFVVISCTSSDKDIKSIINSYDFIVDYHLIFTKIDESENHGNILNGRVLSGRDLAYLTNGQSVPDDIEMATPQIVAELLLEEIDE